jgi:carotenoid cleavage dioxygenase
VNRLDVLRNDIAIWDARDLAAGPVATIHLPFKLKMGLHGNFVDYADIEEWEKRRSKEGDVGPLKAAQEPLTWQVEMQMSDANGTNGVNGAH